MAKKKILKDQECEYSDEVFVIVLELTWRNLCNTNIFVLFHVITKKYFEVVHSQAFATVRFYQVNREASNS